MSSIQKPYVPPTIETIDSNEILEAIGPVQGYGHGMDGPGGMFYQQPPMHNGFGNRD